MPRAAAKPRPDVYLIAEKGTDWGSWVEGCRASGLAVDAIIQSPFEPLDAFTERVKAHLATLAREGCAPATTVLVGGTEWSDGALHARCEAVRALGASVTGRTRLRLVVTCDPRATPDDMAGMRLLGETITRELGSAGRRFDITCAMPRRERGTRRTALRRVLQAAQTPRPARKVA
jgi:hypothetical protein